VAVTFTEPVITREEKAIVQVAVYGAVALAGSETGTATQESIWSPDSEKSTLPVGDVLPMNVGVTVAVNVTDLVATLVGIDETTTVVVGVAETT